MKIIHYISYQTDLDWYMLENGNYSIQLTMEQVCILLSQGITIHNNYL